jgi:NAD(P)-dependent dehydrogenase (short-subunit alcohol dehydrogenase family)
MVGLTEALRMELFGSGIRVSLVMPGVIDTPMTTDARISSDELGSMPAFFKLPARWVTWAVLTAAAFGLTEVDVPPGAAAAEKIASLFPGATDAFLSIGSRVMKAAGRFVGQRSAESESKPEGPEQRKSATA